MWRSTYTEGLLGISTDFSNSVYGTGRTEEYNPSGDVLIMKWEKKRT